MRISYRVVLGDGRVREIEVEGRPLIDADGSRRLLGTSRDVTAERDAERLKDDFFGLVSHELRTPLTSIIGYSELLAEVETREPERAGAPLHRGDRAQLAARAQPRRRPAAADQDHRGHVRDRARARRPDRARRAARSRPRARPPSRPEVELSLEAGGPQVVDGDPHRLAQVVENLVSNAIKFTPRGGRVAVKVERTAGAVALEVTDTGIGIEQDDLGRLFDRMYRAGEAERRHIQGTGLGLTIVKAIVDAHEATIAVDERAREGDHVPGRAAGPPERRDAREHRTRCATARRRAARAGERRMMAGND